MFTTPPSRFTRGGGVSRSGCVVSGVTGEGAKVSRLRP